MESACNITFDDSLSAAAIPRLNSRPFIVFSGALSPPGNLGTGAPRHQSARSLRDLVALAGDHPFARNDRRLSK
jgi:hypothetical protein